MDNPFGRYSPDAISNFTFDWSCPGLRDLKGLRGVSITEAATVFGDRASLTIPLPQADPIENHYVTVGRSYRHRRLVVHHTDAVGRDDERDGPPALSVCLNDAHLVPEDPGGLQAQTSTVE